MTPKMAQLYGQINILEREKIELYEELERLKKATDPLKILRMVEDIEARLNYLEEQWQKNKQD